MSRTLKGTRARGLPPKVLLSQRQDATGSFPTVWRTSSDNRTGKYPVFFNDNKVVPFNQYEAADYDSFLPLGNAVYVEKVENVGAVETGGTKNVTYPTAFAGLPIVVISELSSANGDSSQNVNIFLIASSTSKFTVKFSSDFTGSIVYRAVYDPSPGTLRVVERKPRYPNIFTRFVAKEVMLEGTNTADITFNDFGDDTAENFITFFDNSGNGQADIWPNITTQTRTLVALTASSIATATVEYERFHGLHNRGIIYPLGMNQATILAGLSQENQIEMYGSVSFMSGAVVNQPTKWIVASGSMKKNVADTFITFTPGQDILAFRDSDNPAVDGKISSSVNGINPFYATGSAVDITGQGFQQPLWSKSKIEIDITPSATQTFTLYKSASAGSYPMGYWNPNTRLYEGIGTGKGIDSYSGDLNGLKQALDEQTFGYTFSSDGGAILTGFGAEQYNLYGRQTSTYGFPYHPKFQPNPSQQLLASNYISEPFLLEKIVLELSGSAAFSSIGIDSAAIWSFFILNSRKVVPGSESKQQNVNYALGSVSNYSSFTTSSILNGDTLDVIDTIQIAVSTSLDAFGYLNREQLINKWWPSVGFPVATTGSFQILANSTVKSAISFNSCIPSVFSGSGVDKVECILNSSGRNQYNDTNGRDLVNSFENPIIVGTGSLDLGSGLVKVYINDHYSKANPYVLLPTDKITFGFQLPYSSTNFINSNEFTFSPQGINKITLYGSSLRVNPETNQLEEHHDTLNQLLSSNSICEIIGD